MSVVPASQVVLGSVEWRARRAAHEARADRLVEARRSRAQKGERDPVEDFLFTYYPFRFAAVRRWTPGAGIALAEASMLMEAKATLNKAHASLSETAAVTRATLESTQKQLDEKSATLLQKDEVRWPC